MVPFAGIDPLLSSLRSLRTEPRFEAILHRVGLSSFAGRESCDQPDGCPGNELGSLGNCPRNF